MKKIMWILIMTTILLNAQEHPYQKTEYEYPDDPKVMEKLENWQDLKFGLMMHNWVSWNLGDCALKINHFKTEGVWLTLITKICILI